MAGESLKVLMDSVHKQKIVLPEFQRDFVWPPSAVIKLMTSIFNGYPIGSLLLMENNGAYQHRSIDGTQSFTENAPLDRDLVLDGQQRLTSCYRAFYGTLDKQHKNPGRYYFNYGAFVKQCMNAEIPDGSSLEDYFLFLKPNQIVKKLDTMANEIAAGLFPLNIILNELRGYSYVKWLSEYSFNYMDGDRESFKRLSDISSEFQTRFLERVIGYQVNYEKIVKDTNPDVICTIFETINTTGIKLTVFDLLVAKCFKEGIKLRDKLSDAINQLAWIRQFDPDGTQVATTQIPRILAQLARKECKKGIILKLTPKEISQNWDKAVNGLDRALRILSTRYGSPSSEFVPSMDIITPLSVIVSDDRFSESTYPQLDQWYWCSVFGQYLAGAPESKISRTLKEWQSENGWLSGDSIAPESVREFQFRPSDIEDATKNSAIYKGLFSLMMAHSPFDIGPDRLPISSASPTEIHDHHIFPQKFLADRGIKGARSNQILNRMPILKKTNESIQSKAPEIYLQDKRLTHGSVEADLEAYFCCDRMLASENYSDEWYELFIKDRKTRFLDLIAKAAGKPVDVIVVQEEL